MTGAFIQRLVDAALGPAPAGASRHLLRFTQNNLLGGRILYFVFASGQRLPAWVVRLPRDASRPNNLAHEAELYQDIRKLAARLAGVPERRAVSCEGVTAIVEDFLPGTSLRQRGNRPADLARALDWLVSFQNSTRQGFWSARGLEEEVQAWVGRYEAAYPGARGVRAGVLSLLGEALRLPRPPLPVVAEHGDFNGYNVLVAGDRVSVLDWEWCRLRSQPLYDPLFFIMADILLSGSLPAKADTMLERFRNAFLRDCAASARAGGLLRAYAERTGHTATWLPVSLACVLMARAVRDAELGRVEAPDGSPYQLLLDAFLEEGGRSSVLESFEPARVHSESPLAVDGRDPAP